MGVKAGVSDLQLPFPKGAYTGLFIEMKYGKNTRTPEQNNFLSTMARAGHFVATCYTADATIEIIEKYLSLTPGGVMPVKNNDIFKTVQQIWSTIADLTPDEPKFIIMEPIKKKGKK